VKRSLLLVSGLCAVALTLAGCGGSSSGSDTAASSSAAPSSATGTADPALAPPQQHKTGGRKDVAFDPCTKLDDATVTKAGLQAASRQRGADVLDNPDYTMLSCSFNSGAGQFIVDSTNLDFTSYQKLYHADPMTKISVAGHDGVQFVDGNACVVALRSPDGSFDVQSTTTTTGGDPCAGVQQIAGTLAGALS